ncbi:DUF3562 domain-containing protein [Neisseriaceae bacterium JH1-16]|nr:DUF3562 domain-containing protein [Neisseriaceae bacterium JH1-16]
MNERTRQREVLEIALQTGVSAEEVGQLYDEALQRLAESAQVQDYLLLLASKRVRQSLQARRRSNFDDPLA